MPPFTRQGEEGLRKYRSLRDLRQGGGKAEAVPLPTPSPGEGLRQCRSLLDGL